MPKYTYNQKNEAHYGINLDRRVVVPDQVAENQHEFDGKTFPAMLDGRKIRVRLRGDLYGLGTSGTGDMVVTSA